MKDTFNLLIDTRVTRRMCVGGGGVVVCARLSGTLHALRCVFGTVSESILPCVNRCRRCRFVVCVDGARGAKRRGRAISCLSGPQIWRIDELRVAWLGSRRLLCVSSRQNECAVWPKDGVVKKTCVIELRVASRHERNISSWMCTTTCKS